MQSNNYVDTATKCMYGMIPGEDISLMLLGAKSSWTPSTYMLEYCYYMHVCMYVCMYVCMHMHMYQVIPLQASINPTTSDWWNSRTWETSADFPPVRSIFTLQICTYVTTLVKMKQHRQFRVYPLYGLFVGMYVCMFECMYTWMIVCMYVCMCE